MRTKLYPVTYHNCVKEALLESRMRENLKCGSARDLHWPLNRGGCGVLLVGPLPKSPS